MVREPCFPRRILFFLPLVVLLASCVTIKEGRYVNVTLDELLEKRGLPSYTIDHIIEKNRISNEFEPDFTIHFAEEDLENSVVVKYVSWRKTHSALIVWFKQEDESWVAFSSTEYKGPFLK